jgi:kinetochore protein Spc7/SPC105
MTYKSQLKLFFHPLAFQSGDSPAQRGQNSAISLSYTGSQPLGTTLRFFLQLLRASLHALPQFSTRVAELLGLVAKGWDTAILIADAERRLNLEAMTESRIVSDERLTISSTLLLPKVRTKVRVAFEISAAMGEESEGLEVATTVEPSVTVVYGEQYHEKKMTEFIATETGGGFEGWEGAVRELRERLIARGAKGMKK